ncbi:MAG TPA: Amuc_1098 family type IV pilus outer membrane protein [Chthoniobacterales bacterium]|nr:Amuc_1098 family type IV pilus outer membrane protein [Chthoniobacterales bacterium]
MNDLSRRLLTFVFALLVTLQGGRVRAENVRRIAEHEIARRQAGVLQGQGAAARGKLALQANDFAKAHDEFRVAVNFLPDAITTADQHDAAVKGFCESGVKLAEQRIAEGKYGEAEQLVREVVSDRYDPNCRDALNLLAHFSEPGHFNKTIGPKFIVKVEDVKKLLSDADGYYDSGRYDLAFKKYEQVLNLDPYNVAARRGEERIEHTKTHYGERAYNETRARELWRVQKGWEEPVRQYGQTVGPISDAFARDAGGTARITNKLNSIIIPKIEFRDASVREAIDFLRQQAAANDLSTEGKKGVDIVLRTNALGRAEAPAPLSETAPPLPGVAPEAGGIEPTPVPAPVASSISPGAARITITLNQIPLGEALRYIASQAGLKAKVEPYAVSVIPINEQSSDLFTKEYRVPPGFISSSVNIGASALDKGPTRVGAGGTGKDTQESTGGQQLVNRQTALDFLKDQGVPFPTGASANFLPQSSRLIVRNTEENLELVDALVEQANVAGPKQVEIEAKFVEITQNNLKELGFDWLLGSFDAAENGKLVASGGTSGTSPAVVPGDYPILQNGVPVGQNPVTAGNRSGNLALSANAIDALLFGVPGASSLAPGIFGLSGVMTSPQFQVVVRALNQKKGVDLLSAPRVTTKSGQRAVIEIVREFRYPTQFDPPKIPDTVGSTGNNSGGGTASIPVTPTTPTGFETRNTGVTLEVEPVVGPDGVTIDLNLVPQVVEFEGFINYGSPIFSAATSGSVTLMGMNVITIPGVGQSVLTPNVINQPIFNSRKVTTSVSVWDGQTVVLGGLMREDVQKTEDRTPIIGDIPVLGRLFRTNTEQHIKRNLVIFVTARLVNPAGQPVNSSEEEEETETVSQLEPPVLPQLPYYKK